MAAVLVSASFLGFAALPGCNNGDALPEGKLEMRGATLPGSSMAPKTKGKKTPQSPKERAVSGESPTS
jgi:hypothetical protein